MDARIGQLMREGQIVHYAFVNGYDAPAVEGSLEAIEVALGLRVAFSAPVPALVTPVARVATKRTLRDYEVTVTPTATVHIGSWKSAEYTVEISAYTNNDAIKEARREWNEDVAVGISATYRARLKGLK